ncbi:hypothetical protein A5685_15765 [Mycobacterium colombiense]|uniref:Gfo/Idh/MocA family oxidoreductase n=1 Tax=Mycobacterium colombiense TaxID=339268 RepID=A0A1A2RIB6_9MYCO|nr:Gfo/Idh/MocA family oxidoreductase [Mycobacterium colombiense]OBH51773.1 hypothetical protein A5685_15765 [Mycobacterium colombiense]
MAEPLPGVVVVGTGHGCRVHVPAARNAGLNVVAIVGRDSEKTVRRAKRLGIAHACGSLDEALKLPGADAVIISTPPGTHAPLAEQVIDAGRHVLVEKPFTAAAEQARRLRDCAERAGVVALLGHEFRFDTRRITFRRAIADGLVGPPRIATLIGHNAFAASAELRMPQWWFDKERGGGWLGASVSHIIDATRWWLGDFEAVSVELPMVSARDPHTHAEDTVNARFRLTSGCEGVLQQSAAVHGALLNLFRVAGPQGTVDILDDGVRLSEAGGERMLEPVGPPPIVEMAEGADPRHPLAHVEIPPSSLQATVWRDLIRGVPLMHDALEPATFADGAECMEIIDAMRRSAADGGRLVRVKEVS